MLFSSLGALVKALVVGRTIGFSNAFEDLSKDFDCNFEDESVAVLPLSDSRLSLMSLSSPGTVVIPLSEISVLFVAIEKSLPAVSLLLVARDEVPEVSLLLVATDKSSTEDKDPDVAMLFDEFDRIGDPLFFMYDLRVLAAAFSNILRRFEIERELVCRGRDTGFTFGTDASDFVSF